jgi:hypothetical protein
VPRLVPRLFRSEARTGGGFLNRKKSRCGGQRQFPQLNEDVNEWGSYEACIPSRRIAVLCLFGPRPVNCYRPADFGHRDGRGRSRSAQRAGGNAPAVGTSTGLSYDFLAPNPINTHEYLIKVDYIKSAKNQISGYWVHDYYTFLGNATNLISYDRQVPGITSGLTWTNIINANTVNTLTGSFSGNIITETKDIFPNSLVGIKSVLRSANNLTYSTLFNASPDIPGFSVTGWQTLSSTPLNFDNYERVYAIKDDLAKTIGNHSLKIGISVWRSRKNQTAPGALNGTFGFTPRSLVPPCSTTPCPKATSAQNSTYALEELLMGNYASYTEQSSYSQIWARFTQIEPNVQDDWKVTRRLTLNLGLRWQYMQPQYSALNNTSVFDPAYYVAADAPTIDRTTGNIDVASAYPYNGLVLPGSGFPKQAVGRVAQINNPQVLALFHNLPLGDDNTDWDAFGPRIGFAYDITGKSDTVLRGGYGVSYERVEGNYIFNSVSQLPFVANASLQNGTVDDISGGGSAASVPSEIPTSHALSLAPPRIKNWSVGVQQKLSADTVLEVDYVGSSSADLSYDQDLNQLQPGTTTAAANSGASINFLRPYQGYGDILSTSNGAVFNYNSLQARVTKRMARGGTLNVSYTWSKGLTDAQSYSYLPENTYNLRGDYGPENFNRNQILVISYVYPLPFWRTGDQLYKKLLGGWQVSGLTQISSGLPINVTDPTGADPAGDGLAGTHRPWTATASEPCRKSLCRRRGAKSIPERAVICSGHVRIWRLAGLRNSDADVQQLGRFDSESIPDKRTHRIRFPR